MPHAPFHRQQWPIRRAYTSRRLRLTTFLLARLIAHRCPAIPIAPQRLTRGYTQHPNTTDRQHTRLPLLYPNRSQGEPYSHSSLCPLIHVLQKWLRVDSTLHPPQHLPRRHDRSPLYRTRGVRLHGCSLSIAPNTCATRMAHSTIRSTSAGLDGTSYGFYLDDRTKRVRVAPRSCAHSPDARFPRETTTHRGSPSHSSSQ